MSILYSIPYLDTQEPWRCASHLQDTWTTEARRSQRLCCLLNSFWPMLHSSLTDAKCCFGAGIYLRWVFSCGECSSRGKLYLKTFPKSMEEGTLIWKCSFWSRTSQYSSAHLLPGPKYLCICENTYSVNVKSTHVVMLVNIQMITSPRELVF